MRDQNSDDLEADERLTSSKARCLLFMYTLLVDLTTFFYWSPWSKVPGLIIRLEKYLQKQWQLGKRKLQVLFSLIYNIANVFSSKLVNSWLILRRCKLTSEMCPWSGSTLIRCPLDLKCLFDELPFSVSWCSSPPGHDCLWTQVSRFAHISPTNITLLS